MQPIKQWLFPLLQKLLLKSCVRMFSLNCSTTTSNVILFSWKVCEKMKQRGLLQDDVVTCQGQGQWKWYKMIEVNGSYTHGRYEKNGLKSLRVMSNITFLPHKKNTTHYTHKPWIKTDNNNQRQKIQTHRSTHTHTHTHTHKAQHSREN